MSHQDAPGGTPRATIVVVNRDDAGLSSTLSSLEGLVTRGVATVVVVDASMGRLDHIRREHPLIHWIDFTPTPAGARTIAQQRNLGIREARQRVVVFLDASCVPRDDWFDRLVSPVENGEARVVAGSSSSPSGTTVHDGRLRRGPVREFSALNVAIDRSLFDEIGVFDETLGLAEDVDLAWRATDAGATILFEPEARVIHDFGDDATERRRAYRYGRGRARLYQKHPRRRRTIVRDDRQVVMVCALWVALVVAPVFPWALVTFAYPILKLRRRQPVRSTIYLLCYGAGFIRESLVPRR